MWPALLVASIASVALMPEFPQQQIVLDLKHAPLSQKLLIIISALLIAPITEEFVFRGILYRGLKGFIGALPAILISTILFALVHKNVSSFFVLFLFGILLCYVYEKTESIFSPIFCHMLFNGIMTAMILLK